MRIKAGNQLSEDAEVLDLGSSFSITESDRHVTASLGGSITAPKSNGTDDTATIQALLDEAKNAGGGRVIGTWGETYKVTGLTIGSNVTLDMTGCTVQRLSTATGNTLTNASRSSSRSIQDAVTTASSTTLTSATAAFTSGDVGATIWIYGAGVSGAILKTTIASVTNSTTAVLQTAATVTLSAAAASIGPRDSNFAVIGGIWDAGSTGGTGSLGHNISFRRADNFTVRDVFCTQTLTRGYGVNGGDCTEFTVENAAFNTPSDGVHVNGPARGVRIVGVSGYTGDDSVSITPNDWPGQNDVYGEISDVTIENVRTWKTNGCAVKLIGGNSSTALRRVRVRDIGPTWATQSNLSIGDVIWVGDDTSYAQTTGGTIDAVTIENPYGQASSVVNITGIVYINGTGIERMTVKGLTVDNANVKVDALVVVDNRATVESLRIDGVDLGAMTALDSNTGDVVSVGGTVKNLTVRNVQGASATTGAIVHVSPNGTGTVTRLILDGLNIAKGSGTIGSLILCGTGASLSTVLVNDYAAEASAVGWAIGNFATTTTFHLSNISVSPGQVGAFNLRSTAAVTVYAANCDLGGKDLNTAAGYTAHSKTFGFPCDVSKLNSSTGDMAYNTNTSVAPYVAGPVSYDGSNWIPASGYSKKGTATLVAGAVTVSDAHITANSRIRLAVATPGGTQGALYIAALTASTSFQIKSTSSTDTSTVYYEIVSY